MKQTLMMFVVGVICCSWLGAAQAAIPSPQFLGTWEMDLSKTDPLPPATGDPKTTPKSVTLTVKDAGGGKWSAEIVNEMADGAKYPQPATSLSLDGTPTPSSGDVSLVLTIPDPSTAIITAVVNGQPVSNETYKLSADGKQMFSVEDTIGPDGTPFHTTRTFNKKK